MNAECWNFLGQSRGWALHSVHFPTKAGTVKGNCIRKVHRKLLLSYFFQYLQLQERPRPQFAARAPLMEKNPITGITEPYFPEDTRKRRWLTGIGVLCGMVGWTSIYSSIWIQNKFRYTHIPSHSCNTYAQPATPQTPPHTPTPRTYSQWLRHTCTLIIGYTSQTCNIMSF